MFSADKYHIHPQHTHTHTHTQTQTHTHARTHTLHNVGRPKGLHKVSCFSSLYRDSKGRDKAQSRLSTLRTIIALCETVN